MRRGLKLSEPREWRVSARSPLRGACSASPSAEQSPPRKRQGPGKAGPRVAGIMGLVWLDVYGGGQVGFRWPPHRPRGELVPEVQEAGGKRGSPARPGLPRASEVSVKIRAGSEEGRWECGGRGHRLGALISECGLGPWHRDRGSELLSRASFFQTDEGG